MVLPLLRPLRTSAASLVRRSLATEASSSAGPATAAGAGRVPGGPGAGRSSKLFDDYDYDETTGEGHRMIDKERDALAFMRTVELELPRLVPIPFTPPNLEEEYLRFHTTKTWPLEEDSPEPTWVTLSAPIARLPFVSPAAKHKFLLLVSPHYYHPFRPAAFSLSHVFNTTHASQPRSDKARHRVHKPAHEQHDEQQLTETSLPPTLHTEQAPRVGGHTPANVPRPAFSRKTQEWSTAFNRVDEDREFTRSLAEREGEDADGWFVVRSKKFGYQLQNKKWCVDTLCRLVEAANDHTDPMTDIPLDTSSITTQFMLEKRRPDGTRPSWKDFPAAWAWDVPAVEQTAEAGEAASLQAEAGEGGEASAPVDTEATPDVQAEAPPALEGAGVEGEATASPAAEQMTAPAADAPAPAATSKEPAAEPKPAN